MRRLSVKYFIFLAVCVITACPSPVGSINDAGGGKGNGGSNYNFLMLKPNRQLYALNTLFDKRFSRPDDFQAYAADGGPLVKLEPDDKNLTIEVISAPGFLGTEISEKVSAFYDFPQPGRYIIRGTYFGNTDEYSVEVEGEYSEPGMEYDYGYIKWLDSP